jgi:molybdopterin-guanine dinucleotide biosynthesis protein A
MRTVSVAGVILAGGRSTRMGCRNKALAELDGRPLIRHVIDRLQPQVDALAISVEAASPDFDALGVPQLADPVPGHQGPLGGLLSALRHFGTEREWVLLAPCDAPFLPLNLAHKLLARAGEARASCAAVVYSGELQPTFSLWHRRVQDDLERAVGREGLAGFKQFMGRLAVARYDWPLMQQDGGPEPFFNINDDIALDEARRRMGPAAAGPQACSA